MSGPKMLPSPGMLIIESRRGLHSKPNICDENRTNEEATSGRQMRENTTTIQNAQPGSKTGSSRAEEEKDKGELSTDRLG